MPHTSPDHRFQAVQCGNGQHCSCTETAPAHDFGASMAFKGGACFAMPAEMPLLLSKGKLLCMRVVPDPNCSGPKNPHNALVLRAFRCWTFASISACT
mmetsp:Transcript_15526/g.32354  ORF Transcript_15526/g.32354 Transcript_15526/m.32354 type:complete len:98 (+) Transcript_15526:3-296(+)